MGKAHAHLASAEVLIVEDEPLFGSVWLQVFKATGQKLLQRTRKRRETAWNLCSLILP